MKCLKYFYAKIDFYIHSELKWDVWFGNIQGCNPALKSDFLCHQTKKKVTYKKDQKQFEARNKF